MVEVICVDDGSTDGSGEILDLWAASSTTNHYPLIPRVLHQQNAGVSAARNAALDVATGDWINCIDADDTISERWFEIAFGLIQASPDAEIVKIDPLVSVADEHGPTRPSKRGGAWLDREVAIRQAWTADVRDVCVRRGEEARKWGLKEYSRFGWSMPNFVRRDFIGALRFPVGMRMKEDVCFSLQLANRLTCAISASFPGYFYTRREGSAVMRPRSNDDSLKFVSAMLALICLEFSVQSLAFRRAVSTAIGYEFVQWAEERDPALPYDAKTCPIRAAWRQTWKEGLIDLGDMPFFWRPGIWWWVWTGQLWLAKVTRRVRERVRV